MPASYTHLPTYRNTRILYLNPPRGQAALGHTHAHSRARIHVRLRGVSRHSTCLPAVIAQSNVNKRFRDQRPGTGARGISSARLWTNTRARSRIVGEIRERYGCDFALNDLAGVQVRERASERASERIRAPNGKATPHRFAQAKAKERIHILRFHRRWKRMARGVGTPGTGARPPASVSSVSAS